MEKHGNVEEVKRFWWVLQGVKGRYEADHMAMAKWKRKVRELCAGSANDMLLGLDTRWEKVVRKMLGWRALGPDKLNGWWHRVFPKTNSFLMEKMWEVMNVAGKMPEWMVRGKTVLIPKEGCVGKAGQFRPIACLNTSYKLLTGALAGMISEHTLRLGILPAE